MKRFEVQHLANLDAESITRDYESQQPGLGVRFAHLYRQRLVDIESNPPGFGCIFRSARACLVSPFPIVIYFRIRRDGDVAVFAVRYGRENPAKWRRRYRKS